MKQFLSAWAMLDWLTPLRLEKLLTKYTSLEEAWHYLSKEDLLLCGENTNRVEGILTRKRSIIPEKEWEKLQKFQLQLVFLQDEPYPKLLKNIPQAPVFLLVKGNQSLLQEPSLAIVGTRTPTPYGKQLTEYFSRDLSKYCSIISGLAYGVDSIAHSVCVQEKGKTIAVLGNGLDMIYPKEHQSLAEKILDTGGSIISEFPLGTAPNNFNFPRRNRIIAGLTLGTLLIEGKRKSGSIITAKYALEYNREVFAIPGSIFSELSEAPLHLIQNGEAKLVTCTEDILNELPLHSIPAQQNSFLDFSNEEEKKLFEQLSFDGLSMDILQEKSGFSFQQLSATLTMLELRGIIKNIGNGVWVKTRS